MQPSLGQLRVENNKENRSHFGGLGGKNTGHPFLRCGHSQLYWEPKADGFWLAEGHRTG